MLPGADGRREQRESGSLSGSSGDVAGFDPPESEASKLPKNLTHGGSCGSRSPARNRAPPGAPSGGAGACAVAQAEAQRLTFQALRLLHPIAKRISCVLTYPDMFSEDLRALDFATLAVGHLGQGAPDGGTLLVVSIGLDVARARDAADRFCGADDGRQCVCVFVVLLIPGSPPPHFSVVAPCRAQLLGAGVDDIFVLAEGESLAAYRVLEAAAHAEHIGAQVAERVRMAGGSARERSAAKLKSAYRRFLSEMPAGALDEYCDIGQQFDLHEPTDEAGELAGAGDFVFGDAIGEGACVVVCKAQHPSYGSCAVKIVSKDRAKGVTEYGEVIRELRVWAHLRPHPNIAALHDALHGRHCIYLAMQFAGRLNLAEFVSAKISKHAQGVLAAGYVTLFSQQQVSAVSHLHGMLICHRNLEPTNWVVSDSGRTIRLVDFGCATQICSAEQILSFCCGTLPFCAPEVFRCRRTGDTAPPPDAGYKGPPADIWSLGCCFGELLLGRRGVERLLGWRQQRPSDASDTLKGLCGIPRLLSESLCDGRPITVPKLVRLIGRMATLDPEQRWSITRIIRDGLPLDDDDGRGDFEPPASGSFPAGAAVAAARAAANAALPPDSPANGGAAPRPPPNVARRRPVRRMAPAEAMADGLDDG